jgi:uncharacterized protein YbjQ (UPF0145 family)
MLQIGQAFPKMSSDPDPGQDRDATRRIEQGGIPLEAEQRLRALGAEDGFSASALSVNEFALLGLAGPRPLAQVFGASVMRVGPQYLAPLPPYVKPYARQWESPYEEPSVQQRASYKWNETVVCELDTVTDAWNQARRRAIGRLTEEALHVYADAIVGVHLHTSDHDWSKHTIDYLVSGTAIRAPESTKTTLPVLSNLSVQDYWRLGDAGYVPAGLLMTTAVVFASASRQTRLERLKKVRQNLELEELSEAFCQARALVRQRLESQARSARADGIVGVTFSHDVERQDFSVERTIQQLSTPGWHRGRLGIPYYVSRAGDAERDGWAITMHGAATAVRMAADLARFPPETTVRLS